MSSGFDRPLWWQRSRALVILGVIAASVLLGSPHPAWSGPGLAATLLAVGSVALRIPWIFGWPDDRTISASLLLIGLAGVVLTFLSPTSAAIAFAAFGVASAMERWTVPASVAFAIGLAIFYCIGQIALGHSLTVLAVGPAALAAALLIGTVRRQGNELAAQARSAQEEHARSAALDERARIAREIHDVLAHSLAALTVQLETADALLESGRTAQAHMSVLRASQLAREGLAETRRAIGALRGETLPLPEMLATLTSSYQIDLNAPATVRVDGVPRELRPDVALALYRTAQEAITNVRKHAPGATVEVGLHYGSQEVTVEVTNSAAPDGERPLARSGGGYGLTGLRERAELAGGTVHAGPDGPGWRVDVRIPE